MVEDDEFEEVCVCSYTPLENNQADYLKRFNKGRVRFQFSEYRKIRGDNIGEHLRCDITHDTVSNCSKEHHLRVYITNEYQLNPKRHHVPEYMVEYRDVQVVLGSDEGLHFFKKGKIVKLKYPGCKNNYRLNWRSFPSYNIRVYNDHLYYVGKIARYNVVSGIVKLSLEEIYKVIDETINHKKGVKPEIRGFSLAKLLEDFTYAAFTKNYVYGLWGASGRLRRVDLRSAISDVEVKTLKMLPFNVDTIVALSDDLIVGAGVGVGKKADDRIVKFRIVLYDKMTPLSVAVSTFDNFNNSYRALKIKVIKRPGNVNFILNEFIMENLFFAVNAVYNKKIYLICIKEAHPSFNQNTKIDSNNLRYVAQTSNNTFGLFFEEGESCRMKVIL